MPASSSTVRAPASAGGAGWLGVSGATLGGGQRLASSGRVSEGASALWLKIPPPGVLPVVTSTSTTMRPIATTAIAPPPSQRMIRRLRLIGSSSSSSPLNSTSGGGGGGAIDARVTLPARYPLATV